MAHQRSRPAVLVLVVLLTIGFATPAMAQDPPPVPAAPGAHAAVDVLKFLAGGTAAFAEHEGDHVVFDLLFDAHPFVKSVRFGPVPFFAIAHRPQPPRREFVISSAGFWTQDATSEWLVTRHRDFRHEHAPFEKGAFAFDILTSIGYGIVAMSRSGPIERDTHGMSASIGVDERAIGAIVMAPAVLDGYRYFKSRARWATWTSRLVKVGSVLLVLK